MKDLQAKGLCEKEGSMALTVQQIREILDNNFLNPKTPQSLLKNNQQGIQEGDAQQIHPLFDTPGTFGPVSDIVNYIYKHPSDTSSNFYSQPNPNWRDTSIWYTKTYCGINRDRNFMKDIKQKIKVKLPKGILTNHSGRKTAAQILQDVDISEDAL
ncbi:20518_t:CDS:2 [Gigaspora rosea]|nr:20518_t:CDS:2 [Gigaspora rosea]